MATLIAIMTGMVQSAMVLAMRLLGISWILQHQCMQIMLATGQALMDHVEHHVGIMVGMVLACIAELCQLAVAVCH